MKTMKTALISVYRKDGITDFALELVKLGFTIYASGGTAKHLTKAGIKVLDVATLVGGEAILGHRVVTLSREVHAGLLARYDVPEDMAELERLNIPCIDLVCVDLYPLEQEIAKPDSTESSVIEMTDIGGPTMIRSAAKGCRVIVCDPADRQPVIEWLKSDGQKDPGLPGRLCAKAEFVVANYCMASATYRSAGWYRGLSGERAAECKYGENAHQTPAALFSSGIDDPLALDKFTVVEGTPPSYNNYCDLDRLLQTMTHIVAVLRKNDTEVPFIALGGKHGNVCGAAIGNDVRVVLQDMMAGDPLAIFGGLVMTNFVIDDGIANVLSGKLLDGIIAPGFTGDTIAKLKRKGDKCRFISNPALRLQGAVDGKTSLDGASRFRYVRGGFLRQPNYTFVLDLKDGAWKTYGQQSLQGLTDMFLAWAIGSTSNSNTITLVKNNMLIGNGVGQQDRVGAAKLAIERATRSKHDINGAVAYSDSFFPFPDGPQTLIDAGVKAILTSSGSVKDQATIDVCVKNNVALYMIPDPIGRGFFGH